jgi:LIVCS family branched-chain amino acid:cation transporter
MAPSKPAEAYTSGLAGFSQGFTNGYLTMDAIAAIAFSMIVVNAVKATGVTHANKILKQTVMAGVIAAVALLFIYISLGFIGNHMDVSQAKLDSLAAKDQNVGTYLLTTIAGVGYGVFGKYLLGIIVALACLTTACGLIVSVSEYFNRIFPKIPYKAYVIIFTIISFILANQGLNSVIKMSVPVLSVVYPIAITSVLLILLARLFPTKPIAQRIPVAVVTIVAILSIVDSQGWIKIGFIQALPLKQYSLEWFPVAVVFTIIGYIVAVFVKNEKPIVYEKE